MEAVPHIAYSVQLPLEIELRPYLMDHRVEGRAVLPAVAAMQSLTASTQQHVPGLNATAIENARFTRFVYLSMDTPHLQAINDITKQQDGRVISRLLTRIRSEKSGITRTYTHAAIEFPPVPLDPSPLPADHMFALEGIGIKIHPEAIYRGLIPFGPAFQNIRDALYITPDGVVTTVYAPDHGAGTGPLGSPFPLDAAFHAACVYGQRYTDRVGFPVGFELRRVYKKTRADAAYMVRVAPKPSGKGRLLCDIWIYGTEGLLYEAVLNVVMQDISGGRVTPPQWIMPKTPGDRPGSLPQHGHGLCVMELEMLSPLIKNALSLRELQRYKELGERRRRSFLGARVCLKRLSRVLSHSGTAAPATAITTIAPDSIRPCCPLPDGRAPWFCSVSHDSRFVIAVAAPCRVGVDVEAITKRVLKARHIYMHPQEKTLTDCSSLSSIAASLRIWSSKEAMAKAFNMTLAQAWDQVEIKDITEHLSGVFYKERRYEAAHHQIGNHLFTIVDTGMRH